MALEIGCFDSRDPYWLSASFFFLEHEEKVVLSLFLERELCHIIDKIVCLLWILASKTVYFDRQGIHFLDLLFLGSLLGF